MRLLPSRLAEVLEELATRGQEVEATPDFLLSVVDEALGCLETDDPPASLAYLRKVEDLFTVVVRVANRDKEHVNYQTIRDYHERIQELEKKCR